MTDRAVSMLTSRTGKRRLERDFAAAAPEAAARLPQPSRSTLSRLWMVREEAAGIYKLARAGAMDHEIAHSLIVMLDRIARMLERERTERDLDAHERYQAAMLDLERIRTIIATGQCTPEQTEALRELASQRASRPASRPSWPDSEGPPSSEGPSASPTRSSGGSG